MVRTTDQKYTDDLDAFATRLELSSQVWQAKANTKGNAKSVDAIRAALFVRHDITLPSLDRTWAQLGRKTPVFG